MPFLGSGVGGSHISGLTLAATLQRDYGLECVVVAPDKAGVLQLAKDIGLSTRLSQDKPTSKRYEFHKAVLYIPRQMRFLSKFGRETIVHCNDLNSLLRWGPSARLSGLPVFFHDRAAERPILKRYIVKLATHIITISDFCYDRLSYVASEDKTCVTNPFLPVVSEERNLLKSSILEEMGAPNSSRLVGFVGNFSERKRLRFFLKVASIVAQNLDDVRFVVFGREGDQSVEQVQEWIEELGLKAKCYLAGFRSPPLHNIGALDLLVAPAIDEPFGRTPVEALLLGIPYVATDDAGHSEIFQRWKGGIVVPKSASAVGFSEEVLRALEEPSKLSLSESQIRRIGRDLSPKNHARRVFSCYEKSLETR